VVTGVVWLLGSGACVRHKQLELKNYLIGCLGASFIGMAFPCLLTAPGTAGDILEKPLGSTRNFEGIACGVGVSRVFN
jgi:hypothetical protein